MSTETPRRKRGRPAGSGGGVSLNIKIPRHNFDYLTYLVERKNRLGTTVKEAAQFLLIRDLEALFDAGYHEKEIP
jgi:hypothetical protein